MVCGVETEAYGGYCVALRWPLFMAHPQAQERADAIARIAPPSPTRALLTPTEWGALKNICAGG